MKRAMLTVMFALLLCPSALATPLFLTFKGVVTIDHVNHEWFEERFGIPVEDQLYLGDYAYHTVLIDYDPSLPVDQWGQRFNAEYLFGNSMWVPAYNYGHNTTGIGVNLPGVLFSPPMASSVGDAFFTIYSWDIPVYDWVIGTQVTAHAFGGIIGGHDEFLVLTSITDHQPAGPNPVPEPSTLILCFIGISGLAFRRKFLKNRSTTWSSSIS